MAAKGRPSLYTEGLAAILCDHIANGESLTALCANPANPGYSTVMRWLSEKQDFREKYARACEMRADVLAEQALVIADTATPEEVQKARLQFDARRWYVSKLYPKKYNEKNMVEHSGEVSLAGLVAQSMAKPESDPEK